VERFFASSEQSFYMAEVRAPLPSGESGRSSFAPGRVAAESVELVDALKHELSELDRESSQAAATSDTWMAGKKGPELRRSTPSPSGWDS
jgi:hypothetical protein